MNIDMDEVLNGIINVASDAELIDDESIKKQAMADIVDAISSVIPVERAVGHAGRVTLPRTKIRAINGDLDIVATADVMGRKFCAEAEWQVEKNKTFNEGYVGYVSEKDPDDGWLLARIEFNPKVGGNAAMQMLRGVLAGISRHYGHKRRLKANKRARAAAEKDI